MSIHEPYIYGSTPATHRSCHYHPRTSCIIYILREQVCSIIKDENSIIIINNLSAHYTLIVFTRFSASLQVRQINHYSHAQHLVSIITDQYTLHSSRLLYYGITLELSLKLSLNTHSLQLHYSI